MGQVPKNSVPDRITLQVVDGVTSDPEPIQPHAASLAGLFADCLVPVAFGERHFVRIDTHILRSLGTCSVLLPS